MKNRTVRTILLSVSLRYNLIVYMHTCNDMRVTLLLLLLCVCLLSDDDFIVDDDGRSVRQRKGDGTYAEP